MWWIAACGVAPEPPTPRLAAAPVVSSERGDCLADHEPREPLNAPGLRPTRDRPRNLLLLTLDTTRRDHLSRYAADADAERTPTLSRLAAEGVSLDQHYSCANWTFPSMTCMLSGSNQLQLGLPLATVDPLPESVVTLAQRLSAVGMSTALIAANGIVGGDTGLNRGYGRSRLVASDTHAADVVGLALPWIPELTADPDGWFLHLHFMDAHQPYSPPEGYLDGLADLPPLAFDLETIDGADALEAEWPAMSPEDQSNALAHIEVRYRGGIRHLDDTIADLLAAAESWPSWRDTLVVVASDHGEQMFERGSLGHARTLHNEETASFMVFWMPDGGLEPVAWREATTHADLVPTVLRALGGPVADGISGRVLGYASPFRPIHSAFLSVDRPNLQAVKVRHARLFYTWTGRKEIYDYRSDPREEADHYRSDDCDVTYLWDRAMGPQVEGLAALVDAVPVDARP